MNKTGVVVLCHGSRGPKAVAQMPGIMQKIIDEVANILPGDVKVVWGALQFNKPDLDEAVKSLTDEEMTRIIVMPYFLFSGNHITEDIPEEIERLQGVYPKCEFILTQPMGLESTFPTYIAQRIKSAVPELATGHNPGLMKISPIETESMEIITKLLPPLPGLSEDEKSIVKRIVHAAGDPQVAKRVHFHTGAVASGVAALKAGTKIYTDVKMVQAGISRSMLNSFGGSTHCILSDSEAMHVTPLEGQTRSAAAFHHTGEKLNDAIVAIGNAPTALYAMLELVDSGIKPALVIGMPVGFVKAKESKQELIKYDIPYITIAGRRGGSPAAAATVNALLRIARG